MEAFESFLAACTSSGGMQPIWYLKGTKGMSLAKYYAVLGRKEQALTQLRYSEGLLRNPQHLDLHGNLRCQARYDELDVTPFEDLENKYKEWMSYADYAASHGIYGKEARALETALAALIHCRRDNQEKHHDVYKVWTRLEALFRRLGDVVQLSLSRVATFNAYPISTGAYGTILQWSKDFEMEYPDFEFFEQRLIMVRLLVLIASITNDEMDTAQNMSKINKLMAKRDAFWRKDEERSESNRYRAYQDLRALLPVETDQSRESGYNTEHWLEEWGEEQMFRHPLSDQMCYLNVGSTSGLTPSSKGPLNTLLKWMQESVQHAQLSENEVNLILRLDPAKSTSEDLHRQLSVLDSITVSERLYGSGDTTISAEDCRRGFLKYKIILKVKGMLSLRPYNNNAPIVFLLTEPRTES